MTDKSIHKIPDFKIPDGWRLVDYADLPKGAEYRTAVGSYLDRKPYEGNGIHTLVLIRDIQPDPKGFTLDRWFMPGDADAGDVIHVTTVGEMRNRTDLDQWEYANNGYLLCEWLPFDGEDRSWDWDDDDPDDFPIIVRRKHGN